MQPEGEPDGNGGLTLAWDAPKASEHEVSGYQVFRGNEKLAVTDACSYSEAQTPVGVYDYAVRAVYSDGFVSVPVCAEVANGESVPCSLPFTETFDGGLKPGNWQVLKDQEQMSGNYLWRFDNWFELPVGGAPFEGGFASVNSSAAGYTQVASTLVTPPVSRGAADGSIRTMLEFDLDYKAGGSLTSATLGYMTADGADGGDRDA